MLKFMNSQVRMCIQIYIYIYIYYSPLKTDALLILPQKNARKLDKPVHEMRILLSTVVWRGHIAMLKQMDGDPAQSRKVCFLIDICNEKNVIISISHNNDLISCNCFRLSG